MPIAKPTPTIAINLPNEPFNQSDTFVTKALNSAPVVAADADKANTESTEKMIKQAINHCLLIDRTFIKIPFKKIK